MSNLIQKSGGLYVFLQQSISDNEVTSSASYEQLFNDLRKKWRRYDKISLSKCLLEYIYQTKNARKDISMTFVTATLLLWVISDTYKQKDIQPVTSDKALKLQNALWLLNSHTSIKTLQHKNIALLLRNMIFQQHTLQFDLIRTNFARQWIIFSGLDVSSNLRNSFEEKTGLSVEDSLLVVLFFSLVSKMLEKNFNQCHSVIMQLINQHENLFSTMFAFRDNKLHSKIVVPDKPSAIYAPTPFVKYPLVEIQGIPFVVHPQLAFRTAEMFGYRTVHEHVSSEWQNLTKLIEGYANDRAKQVFSDNARVDSKVRDLMGGGAAENCDQVILLDDCILLVEIKSRHVREDKQVSVNETHLEGVFNDIVLKSHNQLFETHQALQSNKVITPSKKVYWFIVTNDEYNFANGGLFNEFYPQLKQKRASLGRSPAGVFVLTLDEYDILIDAHHANKIDLKTFLSELCLKTESLSADSRFSILEYGDEDLKNHYPEHLKSNFKEAWGRMHSWMKDFLPSAS
ncbi:hypothetical protein DFR44_101199 [Hydromonas duriensis]|uniref:Uncharacterized protein n=2 Tax=Hydromonas duriensis TaxID=1527608 RepID=A0A4R6YBU6_9BURK|nr:hypothetical protein DFR44_101199 [Hydromonas duriensis]